MNKSEKGRTLLMTIDKRMKVAREMYGMEPLLQYQAMMNAALEGDTSVLRYMHEGRGDKESALKQLTIWFGAYISFQESDDEFQYVFVDDASYLSVHINKYDKDGKNHIEVDLVTTQQETFDKIKDKFKSLVQTSPPSNAVLALVSTPNGLGLSALGQFKQELLTCNYSANVIKGFEHVKACLATKSPCGRLVLFQGAPGTGKSYMIRSLVSTVESTFIIVGSNMIADLSGPAILPVLMSTGRDQDKPITFILEDADVALSDRKSSGMNHLSGLLNLGDGLLGEMMDIRIVATTNAGTMELDDAIVRPGRMCQHIMFDSLSATEANVLYSKLVEGKDKDTHITKALTLAEVYRMARQDGWVPPKPTVTHGAYV
jgi:hypothetical protein